MFLNDFSMKNVILYLIRALGYALKNIQFGIFPTHRSLGIFLYSSYQYGRNQICS